MKLEDIVNIIDTSWQTATPVISFFNPVSLFITSNDLPSASNS